jgi:pimeloyl-ACP methyl ester carboxylesterase
MPDLADLFPGYAPKWINTTSGRIFARVGGKGPPLLLLHGFSETHVMWHRVAPQLADKFTLIIADLPGYGWSDMPESTAITRPTPSARWRRPWWRRWKRSAMCTLRSPGTIAAAASRIGWRWTIRAGCRS